VLGSSLLPCKRDQYLAVHFVFLEFISNTLLALQTGLESD